MTQTQRNISYGELAELQAEFDRQAEADGIEFECDEQRQECEFDFIDQYINGNDNPEIYIA